MGKIVKFRGKDGTPRAHKPRRSFSGLQVPLPVAGLIGLIALAVLITFAKTVDFGDFLREPDIKPIAVRDGRTLLIWGQAIRLYGIDAPEPDQTCQDLNGKVWECGREAIRALEGKVLSGEAEVHCESKDTDDYGRAASVCYLGDLNLNEWMVLEGYAVAYRRFAYDYVEAEEKAQKARKGLWAGSFVQPEDWRRGKRL